MTEKDDNTTRTTDPVSSNAFEAGMPGTAARDRSEGRIEGVRDLGGVFVEAVRATRLPMVLTDPELPGDPVVFANQAFLELSGYSMAEVLGQQPHFMNGPDTDPDDAARFEQILADDADGVVETIQYAKDGRRFVASVLLSAFKDDAGRTIHHFLTWTDVTRRAEAENANAVLRTTQAALREREEQYRDALNSMSEGFALFDADFTILEVNAETLRLDGRPREEIVGRNHWEAFPGSEDSPQGEMFKRVMRDRVPEAMGHSYRWPDGKTLWVDTRAYPTTHGRVGILWRDITDRKLTEQALRDSEQRFRSALGISTVGVIFWDQDLRLTEVNDAFLRFTGFTREEAIGKSWQELTPPDFHADSERAVAELAETGQGTPYEKQYYRKDGSCWWGLFAPQRLSESEVVEFVIDVSERRRAEEALREREERLRLIVENARDYAIFTIDREGIVTDWREGAQAVFGYSSEEITGRSGDILYTPDDIAAHQPQAEREQAAREGKAPNVRWHVRKDRSRVFIEGVATPLHDADGNLAGYLKVGRDATERHAADERQKLLLAELQHRVRNILAMIRSMVRQSREGYDDLEEFSAHLVGRLDAMARTQVILTRAAGAKVDLETLVWDELEAQIAEEMRVTVKGPKVELSPKAAEVLTLALHELATNSVKYGALMDEAGRLSVTWGVAPVGGEDWLQLTWDETCLNVAPQPIRAGFGTELIEDRVPYELRGEASLDISRGGVRAEIAFPLSEGASILETGPAVEAGDG